MPQFLLGASPEHVPVVLELLEVLLVDDDQQGALDRITRREIRVCVRPETGLIDVAELGTRFACIALTAAQLASAAITEAAYATGRAPLELLTELGARWREMPEGEAS